ncbi:MAG: HmuY family protein [Bacteroidota bacterium]
MNLLSRKLLLIALIGFTLLVVSCNDDDTPEVTPLGVAFETTAIGIEDGASSVTVNVTFSQMTTVSNQITIMLDEDGVTYGSDYNTDPAAVNGVLSIEVPVGSEGFSFTVNRIGDAIDEGNNVKFTLDSVVGEETSQISGNTEITVSFSAVASGGSSLIAEIGGPTQPNQVFVDLSLNNQTTAERTSWDFGFYNGSEDKVIVNYATYGMAYELEKTDINAVTAEDTVGLSATVGIGRPGAHVYIDNPDGDLDKLAIADISDNDDDNKVYIINSGAGPGNGDVDPGSVDVGSTPLGWKKVRILKRNGDYLIQYADISATSFEEATITRTANQSFNYFSLSSGNTVTVQPGAAKWDLEFTVSSNIINFGAGDGAYGFSDFVRTNRLGGTKVAVVTLERDDDGNILSGQTGYDDFTAADLANVQFSDAANTIGSGWRSVFSRTAHNYRYYIIEDSEGNQYKLQFLGLLNEQGERGNSSFKYELL